MSFLTLAGKKSMAKKVKNAVILTIKDAGNMTTKGRKQISDWLIKKAKDLIKEGNLYDKRFTARYQIPEPKE
jgi:hypothetical protein